MPKLALLLALLLAEVWLEDEAPCVLVNECHVPTGFGAKHTGALATEAESLEFAAGVGLSGSTSRFSWLAGVLFGRGLELGVLRDVAGFSDVVLTGGLCCNFFSVKVLLVATGRACFALDEAVLPSKGLEATFLPGNCLALGC